MLYTNLLFFKELLRRTAEHYLKDMVQLIFMRLPQFSDDIRSVIIKQLKMGPGAMDQARNKRKTKSGYKRKDKTGKLFFNFYVFKKILLQYLASGIKVKQKNFCITIHILTLYYIVWGCVTVKHIHL